MKIKDLSFDEQALIIKIRRFVDSDDELGEDILRHLMKDRCNHCFSKYRKFYECPKCDPVDVSDR